MWQQVTRVSSLGFITRNPGQQPGPLFAQRPNKGQNLSGRGSKRELGKEHLVPSSHLSKSGSLDGREEELVLRGALVQLVLQSNCRTQGAVSDVRSREAAAAFRCLFSIFSALVCGSTKD